MVRRAWRGGKLPPMQLPITNLCLLPKRPFSENKIKAFNSSLLIRRG